MQRSRYSVSVDKKIVIQVGSTEQFFPVTIAEHGKGTREFAENASVRARSPRGLPITLKTGLGFYCYVVLRFFSYFESVCCKLYGQI